MEANFCRQYSYVRPSKSLSSPAPCIWILVNKSTTSPKRLLSSSGRAKFFGRIPFKRAFSCSIRRIALSIVTPIEGWCASAEITDQRASLGTKNTLSAMYSSLSSGSASGSCTRAAYLVSKRSEIYLRKMSPRTTPSYSDAFKLPRSTSAAFQILSSNPMEIVSFAMIYLFSKPLRCKGT